jgi:hypothetical protein
MVFKMATNSLEEEFDWLILISLSAITSVTLLMLLGQGFNYAIATMAGMFALSLLRLSYAIGRKKGWLKN